MGSSSSWAGSLAAVLILAALLAAAGLVLFRRMQKTAERSKARKVPRQWPLNPRLVVNTAERAVWLHLQEAFPDAIIMVKMPVTRYTTPRSREEAKDWFEMLNNIYCTFAVCTPEGRVVGCVDVAGPAGLSSANRHLKQTLLEQCGIAYLPIDPGTPLPATTTLRAEFLGAPAAAQGPANPSNTDLLRHVRNHLHETLDRNRDYRRRSEDGSTDPEQSWRQPDSFLAPFDSRRSGLNRR
ncbi:MAG: DUF2726 domain-containing protein [Comamonadaceae bacterium]|nr:DUF2726 domain-containing protein [Comamonadaceae bacterium]RRD56954.1 DUF2726 domain-containing protein [Comamonadaceae bacterium OH2545_COT-014]